jgi:hypothetical protein
VLVPGSAAVIALPEGAAVEIVIRGQNGFLVNDEQRMGALATAVDICMARLNTRDTASVA